MKPTRFQKEIMNSAHSFTEGYIMEETTAKPKSSHLSTAVKAIERQIAKDEAAITRLIQKKNELDVSIELLRESIEGLSSEVERLRNREAAQ